MKKILFLCFSLLIISFVHAQEKSKTKVSEKPASRTAQTGEVKLDDLHLEALIEKPSVSVLPKRIEPDLEKVEFISRKFDRELKVIPEKLFDMHLEKNKVQKIREIEKILKKQRE